jgi:hypothetical protein
MAVAASATFELLKAGAEAVDGGRLDDAILQGLFIGFDPAQFAGPVLFEI